MKKITRILGALIAILLLSLPTWAQTALVKTTLGAAVTTTSGTSITVASITGITAGVNLLVDTELMTVSSTPTSGTLQVSVTRGSVGTVANTHATSSVVLVVPGAATVGQIAAGSCILSQQQYGTNVTVQNGLVYVGICRYTAAAQTTRRWAWTVVPSITFNSILWCDGSGC